MRRCQGLFVLSLAFSGFGWSAGSAVEPVPHCGGDYAGLAAAQGRKVPANAREENLGTSPLNHVHGLPIPHRKFALNFLDILRDIQTRMGLWRAFLGQNISADEIVAQSKIGNLDWLLARKQRSAARQLTINTHFFSRLFGRGIKIGDLKFDRPVLMNLESIFLNVEASLVEIAVANREIAMFRGLKAQAGVDPALAERLDVLISKRRRLIASRNILYSDSYLFYSIYDRYLTSMTKLERGEDLDGLAGGVIRAAADEGGAEAKAVMANIPEPGREASGRVWQEQAARLRSQLGFRDHLFTSSRWDDTSLLADELAWAGVPPTQAGMLVPRTWKAVVNPEVLLAREQGTIRAVEDYAQNPEIRELIMLCRKQNQWSALAHYITNTPLIPDLLNKTMGLVPGIGPKLANSTAVKGFFRSLTDARATNNYTTTITRMIRNEDMTDLDLLRELREYINDREFIETFMRRTDLTEISTRMLALAKQSDNIAHYNDLVLEMERAIDARKTLGYLSPNHTLSPARQIYQLLLFAGAISFAVSQHDRFTDILDSFRRKYGYDPLPSDRDIPRDLKILVEETLRKHPELQPQMEATLREMERTLQSFPMEPAK